MSEAKDDQWDAVEEGTELLLEGDIEGAIRSLEAVITLDPKNAYAFFYLGNAHYERGTFDKAVKAYLTAVQIAPDYLGAMVSLGHGLRMLGRHQEAIRVARQVLARSSEDPDALHMLGLVHFSRGERAAAKQYLERFIATRPEVEVANEVTGILEMLRREEPPN